MSEHSKAEAIETLKEIIGFLEREAEVTARETLLEAADGWTKNRPIDDEFRAYLRDRAADAV